MNYIFYILQSPHSKDITMRGYKQKVVVEYVRATYVVSD